MDHDPDQNLSRVPSQPEVCPSPRTRKLLTLLFAIVVVYPFVKYGFVETWGYTGFDWGIYYQAAQDLRSGKSPYPHEVLAGEETASPWNKYMYPPLFARLLGPFTFLPELWAKRLFVLANALLCLLLLFPRGKRFAGTRIEWMGTVGWALSAAFVLGWGPAIENFRVGQANLLPLFPIVVAWHQLGGFDPPKEKPRNFRKEATAGACLGVASAVKLTPLVYFPVLLAGFRFRMAFWMLVGFAGASILPGPRTCLQYVGAVLPELSRFPADREAYTFSGLLQSAFERIADLAGFNEPASTWTGTPAITLGGLFLAGVLVFLFANRRRLESADLVAIGCYLPPLLGGVWFHHYALALFPILVAIPLLTRRWGTSVSSSSPVLTNTIGSPAFLRLAAFVIVLLPGLTYWAPLHAMVQGLATALSVSSRSLFVAGNMVAFLVILHEMARKERVP